MTTTTTTIKQEKSEHVLNVVCHKVNAFLYNSFVQINRPNGRIHRRNGVERKRENYINSMRFKHPHSIFISILSPSHSLYTLRYLTMAAFERFAAQFL